MSAWMGTLGGKEGVPLCRKFSPFLFLSLPGPTFLSFFLIYFSFPRSFLRLLLRPRPSVEPSSPAFPPRGGAGGKTVLGRRWSQKGGEGRCAFHSAKKGGGGGVARPRGKEGEGHGKKEWRLDGMGLLLHVRGSSERRRLSFFHIHSRAPEFALKGRARFFALSRRHCFGFLGCTVGRKGRGVGGGGRCLGRPPA